MDLVVGLGVPVLGLVPVLDLTVPLVQPASSVATTAAVTRAEPRRVGRMTPVCHRPTPTLMREPEFRVRPDNGVLAEGPLLDTRSVEYLAERLAAVPGVVAVTLGGSRAAGAAVEGSDWDFGLYYRGGLDPADISALGWPGAGGCSTRSGLPNGPGSTPSRTGSRNPGRTWARSSPTSAPAST